MQNTSLFTALDNHNNLIFKVLSDIYHKLNPAHCFIAKVEPLKAEITTLFI